MVVLTTTAAAAATTSTTMGGRSMRARTLRGTLPPPTPPEPPLHGNVEYDNVYVENLQTSAAGCCCLSPSSRPNFSLTLTSSRILLSPSPNAGLLLITDAHQFQSSHSEIRAGLQRKRKI